MCIDENTILQYENYFDNSCSRRKKSRNVKSVSKKSRRGKTYNPHVCRVPDCIVSQIGIDDSDVWWTNQKGLDNESSSSGRSELHSFTVLTNPDSTDSGGCSDKCLGCSECVVFINNDSGELEKYLTVLDLVFDMYARQNDLIELQLVEARQRSRRDKLLRIFEDFVEEWFSLPKHHLMWRRFKSDGVDHIYDPIHLTVSSTDEYCTNDLGSLLSSSGMSSWAMMVYDLTTHKTMSAGYDSYQRCRFVNI